MQIKETSPGKPCAVTSIEGCTVYVEVNGALEEFESVDPNSQKCFIAPAEQIHLSDDTALFTEVFKLAPAAIGSGGTSWYTELMNGLAEILPDRSSYVVVADDENKLVVHTDRVDDTTLAEVNSLLESVLPQDVEVEQYNHHIEVSWRDINKYAECTTAIEMYEADTSKNYFDSAKGYQIADVCSDGTFPYPNKLKSVHAYGSNYGSNLFSNAMAELGRLEGSFPELTDFFGGYSVREIVLDAPKLQGFQEVYVSSLKRIKCNSQNITSAVHLFWSKQLEIVECDFPKLSAANFTANSKLNKESTLRILNSIPAYTSGSHPMQLGIHTDLQQDEEVLAAISNAEAKGWTLTVQWNGTPTAQGASTMAFGKLIFAKVSEMERPDGTTEQYLDWGHYVTNPEEYETFRSLESAYEYFGLPAEDTELTEELTDETE